MKNWTYEEITCLIIRGMDNAKKECKTLQEMEIIHKTARHIQKVLDHSGLMKSEEEIKPWKEEQRCQKLLN